MKMKQAKMLCDAVLRHFFEEQTGILREYAPAQAQDRDSCFLFSYFATTGMLYQAIKAGIAYEDVYKKLIEGFSYYRSASLPGDSIKYHSERGNAPGAGQGPCFFDDNIWVARNFLFAYELLKEPQYLQEAQRIVRYTYTAWNWELGGLVWNENGLGDNATQQELERGLSANACSILVNAQLYQLTGDNNYLDWAHRFYAFCKTTQDSQSKMYYNGVHTLLDGGKRVAGEVNKDLYAYNPGSMILADLVLYQITSDSAYLEDAKHACQAAHLAFFRKESSNRPAYYQDFVWFLTIFAEACQALQAAGSDVWQPVIKTFDCSLAYALAHHLSPSNLLPHDYVPGWRDIGQQEEYDRLLLTHSGTAETAIICAELDWS